MSRGEPYGGAGCDGGPRRRPVPGGAVRRGRRAPAGRPGPGERRPGAAAEARCSFRFRESGWQETSRPAELLEDRLLRERLGAVETAWWRRDGEVLYLALPLAEDRPFPLETLFCLARPERVEGWPCAVYAFRRGEPVPP